MNPFLFRDDFEFSDAAGPSHLGHGAAPVVAELADAPAAAPVIETVEGWTPDAMKELNKIPFFVRGKARRNTERYASEKGVAAISVETLYEAKAHYAR